MKYKAEVKRLNREIDRLRDVIARKDENVRVLRQALEAQRDADRTRRSATTPGGHAHAMLQADYAERLRDAALAATAPVVPE